MSPRPFTGRAAGAVLGDRYVIATLLTSPGLLFEAEDTKLGTRVLLALASRPETAKAEDLASAARALAGARHRAVPRVLDYFDEGAEFCLVTEMADGADPESALLARRRPFPAHTVLGWLDELCGALGALDHETRRVLPRVLGLESILLADGEARLADLGILGGRGVRAGPETPLEVLDGDAPDGPSDVYTLAHAAVRLASGTPVVSAAARAVASLRGVSDPLFMRIDLHGLFGSAASPLIAALDLLPERRPTFAELQAAASGPTRRHARAAAQAIVRTSAGPRDPDEVQRARARLTELAGLVADRELELATVRASVDAFERRYLATVGPLYVELDRLRAELARRRARASSGDPDLERLAHEAEDRYRESAAAFEDTDDEPSVESFEPDEELKRLFRRAAFEMHPDRPDGPDNAKLRHELRVWLNAAYRAADRESMSAILDEFFDSRPAVRSEPEDLARLLERVARLERRLYLLGAEIARIHLSDRYELFARSERAAEEGRDLLAELERDARAEIDAARAELGRTDTGGL